MDTFFFDLKLHQAALFTGALGVLLGLPLTLAPARCRALLSSFPRHPGAAWALTAACVLWVTWIVWHAALGRFEFLKPGLYLAAPAVFFLLIHFLDELLAARALGGLLLLMANPVLNAARWHDTPWRFVMTALAYAWVVAGMALVLSPYLFRRWSRVAAADDARCRATGIAALALAALLVGLGLTLYRGG
jgi:hypothetical protein